MYRVLNSSRPDSDDNTQTNLKIFELIDCLVCGESGWRLQSSLSNVHYTAPGPVTGGPPYQEEAHNSHNNVRGAQ